MTPARAASIEPYLDFQAAVGITKHTGGIAATRDLLRLCHVDEAREVLEVGCGIGVGVANLARAHRCRVVGIDRSPGMITWARRRAREHGVEDRVELLVADAAQLPFADGRFEVVYAESVLAFVDDPTRALREMARVTRPGGYVGISESIWTEAPTPELEQMMRDLDAGVRSPEDWRSMCAAVGLRDLEVRLRRIDPAAEVRNRIRWVGLRWAARAWGRTLWRLVTEPRSRAAIRTFYGPGLTVFGSLGYGLFAGRVGTGGSTERDTSGGKRTSRKRLMSLKVRTP